MRRHHLLSPRAAIALLGVATSFFLACHPPIELPYRDEEQSPENDSVPDGDSPAPSEKIKKTKDNFAWAQPSSATDPATSSDADTVVWTRVTDETLVSKGRTAPVLFAEENSLWLIEGYRAGFRQHDIWTTEDGSYWHIASWSDRASFSDRFAGHVGVSHNGSLFLVGGAGPDDVTTPRGRVYRFDPEQVSFTLVTDDAPFGPVSFPAVVSFDDRLWVFGGRLPDGTYPTAAWSSPDGVSWEATAYPPTAGRQGAAVAVFDGKLWFIGGESAEHLWRDVWATSDGVSWERVLSAAPFAPGGGMAFVHEERIYRLGSFAEGKRDLWSSSDGLSWEEEPIPTEDLPFGVTATSFKEDLYLIAGNDSWFLYRKNSDPDAMWEQITRPFLFPPMTHFTAVFFNNRFLAVTNIAASPPSIGSPGLSEVWDSTDGISWRRLLKVPPFAAPSTPRSGHALVTFNDAVFLIGGEFNNKVLSDIWKTTDGRNWTLVTSDGGFSPRQWHRTAVFNDRLWLVGGYDQDGDAISDVWYSDDGVTFSCASVEAPFPRRGEHSLTPFKDTLWIIGGQVPPYDSLRDIWRSQDGFSWKETLSDAPFSIRYGHSVTEVNGALWLFGGFKYSLVSEEMLADLWRSTDGVHWEQVSYQPQNITPRYRHAAVARGNTLFLFGGLSKRESGVSSYAIVSEVLFATMPSPD